MNKKYKASTVRYRERKSVRYLEKFSKQEKSEQNKISKHQHRPIHTPTMISFLIYFNLVGSNALKKSANFKKCALIMKINDFQILGNFFLDNIPTEHHCLQHRINSQKYSFHLL